MRRREFITLLGAAAGWPLAARAQQPAKVHRVGFITAAAPGSALVGSNLGNPAVRGFVQGLRELGYVEGTNLVLEWRTAEGKFERFHDIVRELVSIKVDVIVTINNSMTRAAKEVTQTVPIVMHSGNPVEEGLIQSLARPGGNITGLTAYTGLEISTKQVQLLKEIVPRMSRVAVLLPKPETLAHWKQIAEAITRELGVKLLFTEHAPSDYAAAFALIERERQDALLVPASAVNFPNRRLIVEFAAKNRLPAMYVSREYADAGGLISYGAEVADVFRRLAGYVDRILKGAKPADMPVEQPSKFQLTINLKTAKTLGLSIPSTLLASADEVIE